MVHMGSAGNLGIKAGDGAVVFKLHGELDLCVLVVEMFKEVVKGRQTTKAS